MQLKFSTHNTKIKVKYLLLKSHHMMCGRSGENSKTNQFWKSWIVKFEIVKNGWFGFVFSRTERATDYCLFFSQYSTKVRFLAF